MSRIPSTALFSIQILYSNYLYLHLRCTPAARIKAWLPYFFEPVCSICNSFRNQFINIISESNTAEQCHASEPQKSPLPKQTPSLFCHIHSQQLPNVKCQTSGQHSSNEDSEVLLGEWSEYWTLVLLQQKIFVLSELVPYFKSFWGHLFELNSILAGNSVADQ
jgi:hypothetical protein